MGIIRAARESGQIQKVLDKSSLKNSKSGRSHESNPTPASDFPVALQGPFPNGIPLSFLALLRCPVSDVFQKYHLSGFEGLVLGTFLIFLLSSFKKKERKKKTAALTSLRVT